MSKKPLKITKRRTPAQLRDHVNELIETMKAKIGTAHYPGASREELHIDCRRVGCQCTHDFPCEAGWIEKDGTDGVVACPRCRPEVRAVNAAATGSREKFQSMIRNPDARAQAQGQHGWD